MSCAKIVFPALLAAIVSAGCAQVHQPGIHQQGIAEPIRTLWIDSGKAWQNTHVWAEEGDLIVIRAEGTWSPGLVDCGPDGVDFPVYKYTPLFLLFYLPNFISTAPLNLLIARIGKGNPMPVGSRAEFRAPESGELYLAPNDYFLMNNTGGLRVCVKVQRRHGRGSVRSAEKSNDHLLRNPAKKLTSR